MRSYSPLYPPFPPLFPFYRYVCFSLVEGLLRVCIVCVSCGTGDDAHTLALTNNGVAYSWGDGDHGKLGHGDTERQLRPRAIVFDFENLRVKALQAGNDVSLAINEAGTLFTWGHGYYSGHALGTDQCVPVAVETLRPHIVVSASQRYHYGLAATQTGLVFSWGSFANSPPPAHRSYIPQLLPDVSEKDVNHVFTGTEQALVWKGHKLDTNVLRPFRPASDDPMMVLHETVLLTHVSLAKLGLPETRPVDVSNALCAVLFLQALFDMSLAGGRPLALPTNLVTGLRSDLLCAVTASGTPEILRISCQTCLISGWHLLALSPEEAARVCKTVIAQTVASSPSSTLGIAQQALFERALPIILPTPHIQTSVVLETLALPCGPGRDHIIISVITALVASHSLQYTLDELLSSCGGQLAASLSTAPFFCLLRQLIYDGWAQPEDKGNELLSIAFRLVLDFQRLLLATVIHEPARGPAFVFGEFLRVMLQAAIEALQPLHDHAIISERLAARWGVLLHELVVGAGLALSQLELASAVEPMLELLLVLNTACCTLVAVRLADLQDVSLPFEFDFDKPDLGSAPLLACHQLAAATIAVSAASQPQDYHILHMPEAAFLKVIIRMVNLDDPRARIVLLDFAGNVVSTLRTNQHRQPFGREVIVPGPLLHVQYCASPSDPNAAASWQFVGDIVGYKHPEGSMLRLTPAPVGVLESAHPYRPGQHVTDVLTSTQAVVLILDFDPACATSSVDDVVFVRPSKDGAHELLDVRPCFAGPCAGWPGTPIFLLDDTLDFEFRSDGAENDNVCADDAWGYRIVVKSLVWSEAVEDAPLAARADVVILHSFALEFARTLALSVGQCLHHSNQPRAPVVCADLEVYTTLFANGPAESQDGSGALQDLALAAQHVSSLASLFSRHFSMFLPHHNAALMTCLHPLMAVLAFHTGASLDFLATVSCAQDLEQQDRQQPVLRHIFSAVSSIFQSMVQQHQGQSMTYDDLAAELRRRCLFLQLHVGPAHEAGRDAVTLVTPTLAVDPKQQCAAIIQDITHFLTAQLIDKTPNLDCLIEAFRAHEQEAARLTKSFERTLAVLRTVRVELLPSVHHQLVCGVQGLFPPHGSTCDCVRLHQRQPLLLAHSGRQRLAQTKHLLGAFSFAAVQERLTVLAKTIPKKACSEAWLQLLTEPVDRASLLAFLDDLMQLMGSLSQRALSAFVVQHLDLVRFLGCCLAIVPSQAISAMLPPMVSHNSHPHPLLKKASNTAGSGAAWICNVCSQPFEATAVLEHYRCTADCDFDVCCNCVQNPRARRPVHPNLVTTENVKLGARVIRGRDWDKDGHGNKDGGAGHAGTVIGFRRLTGEKVGQVSCVEGCCDVNWDHGAQQSTHRIGRNDSFALCYLEMPIFYNRQRLPTPTAVKWFVQGLLRSLVANLAVAAQPIALVQSVQDVCVQLLQQSPIITRRRLLSFFLSLSCSVHLQPAISTPGFVANLLDGMTELTDLTCDILTLRLLSRVLPLWTASGWLEQIPLFVERLFALMTKMEHESVAMGRAESFLPLFFEMVGLVRRLHTTGAPGWAMNINEVILQQLSILPHHLTQSVGHVTYQPVLLALGAVANVGSVVRWRRLGAEINILSQRGCGTIVHLNLSDGLAQIQLESCKAVFQNFSFASLRPLQDFEPSLPLERLPVTLQLSAHCEHMARLALGDVPQPGTQGPVLLHLMAVLSKLWSPDNIAASLGTGRSNDLLLELLRVAVRPSALRAYTRQDLEDFCLRLLHTPPTRGSCAFDTLVHCIFAGNHWFTLRTAGLLGAVLPEDAEEVRSSAFPASHSLVWDRSASTVGVVVDEQHPQLVRRDRGSARAYVLGSIGMRSGRHRWRLRIDKEIRGDEGTFVGVASSRLRQMRLQTGTVVDEVDQLERPDMWLYSAYSGRYYHGHRMPKFGAKFSAGDIITLELDMDKGALAVGKNDALVLDVAFTDILEEAAEVFPVIYFVDRNRQQVALLDYSPAISTPPQVLGFPSQSDPLGQQHVVAPSKRFYVPPPTFLGPASLDLVLGCDLDNATREAVLLATLGALQGRLAQELVLKWLTQLGPGVVVAQRADVVLHLVDLLKLATAGRVEGDRATWTIKRALQRVFSQEPDLAVVFLSAMEYELHCEENENLSDMSESVVLRCPQDPLSPQSLFKGIITIPAAQQLQIALPQIQVADYRLLTLSDKRGYLRTILPDAGSAGLLVTVPGDTVEWTLEGVVPRFQGLELKITPTGNDTSSLLFQSDQDILCQPKGQFFRSLLLTLAEMDALPPKVVPYFCRTLAAMSMCVHVKQTEQIWAMSRLHQTLQHYSPALVPSLWHDVQVVPQEEAWRASLADVQHIVSELQKASGGAGTLGKGSITWLTAKLVLRLLGFRLAARDLHYLHRLLNKLPATPSLLDADMVLQMYHHACKMAFSAGLDEAARVVTLKNVAVGAQVVRGPDWERLAYYDTDGGQGNVGTVTGFRDDQGVVYGSDQAMEGCCTVDWVKGVAGYCHRIGREGMFTLLFAPQITQYTAAAAARQQTVVPNITYVGPATASDPNHLWDRLALHLCQKLPMQYLYEQELVLQSKTQLFFSAYCRSMLHLALQLKLDTKPSVAKHCASAVLVHGHVGVHADKMGLYRLVEGTEAEADGPVWVQGPWRLSYAGHSWWIGGIGASQAVLHREGATPTPYTLLPDRPWMAITLQGMWLPESQLQVVELERCSCTATSPEREHIGFPFLQLMFTCQTCQLDGNCCLPCAVRCHTDHIIVEVFTQCRVCQCSTKGCCKAVAKPPMALLSELAWFQDFCRMQRSLHALSDQRDFSPAFVTAVRKVLPAASLSDVALNNEQFLSSGADVELLDWYHHHPAPWMKWPLRAVGSQVLMWHHNKADVLALPAVAQLNPVDLCASADGGLLILQDDGNVLLTRDPTEHNLSAKGFVRVGFPPGVHVTRLRATLAVRPQNVALSGDGQVWQWCTPSPPSLVPSVAMAFVACGEHHFAALDRNGKLYTWGNGRAGELGHGSNADCTLPRLVASLEDRVVCDVACGDAHTVAISDDGAFVWSWGSNAQGQLGHGDAVDHQSPAQISTMDGMATQHVYCGQQFSMVLVRNGAVYAWGYGHGNRLALESNKSFSSPQTVPGLSGVVRLALGLSNGLAVLAAGDVLVWGTNSAPVVSTADPQAGQLVTRDAVVIGLRVERSGTCREDSPYCTLREGIGTVVRNDEDNWVQVQWDHRDERDIYRVSRDLVFARTQTNIAAGTLHCMSTVGGPLYLMDNFYCGRHINLAW